MGLLPGLCPSDLGVVAIRSSPQHGLEACYALVRWSVSILRIVTSWVWLRHLCGRLSSGMSKVRT
jgi:hypothetical protein